MPLLIWITNGNNVKTGVDEVGVGAGLGSCFFINYTTFDWTSTENESREYANRSGKVGEIHHYRYQVINEENNHS